MSVDVAEPQSAAPPRLGRPRHLRLRGQLPLLQLVALVVVVVYGAATIPSFLSWETLRSVLVLCSLVGIAAFGQTFVALLGGLDLSVAGFSVTSALFVVEMPRLHGWGFWPSVVVVVVGLALLGGLSGALSTRFAIQPLIGTLAVGTVAVGLVQVITRNDTTGVAPEWLSTFTSPATTTFGLPVPPLVVSWVVLIALTALVLRRTATGARLYATGTNKRAARLVGIRVDRVTIAVFALSGVGSALLGILLTGFAGSANLALGDPYLFQGITAVIVGGTVFGGPGSYTRTALGALLINLLSTILVGRGLSSADQQIVYGVVIALVVAAYGRDDRLRDRV